MRARFRRDWREVTGCAEVSATEKAIEGHLAMIRHTVVFRLKTRRAPPEERDFLAAARALAAIPGVEKFEQLRQVSAQERLRLRLLDGVRRSGRL